MTTKHKLVLMAAPNVDVYTVSQKTAPCYLCSDFVK